MYCDLGLYIDGRWIGAQERDCEPVINPATGKVIGDLPHATAADLDAALDSAARGFALWRKTPALERCRIIRKAADLIRERADAIARILTLEEGKTLREARLEVESSVDTLDWNAEEGRRAYGRIVPARVPGVRQMVQPEPIGPVLALTPWNFPALTPARKIGAALAAGCSVIIKAAEETPGTCVEIVRAFADAGLPAGVLNLVFGVPAEVSEHLIASPVIRKVSFTGSIPVGKHLTALAAAGMKRTTMELGGHSPVVVFDDVDVARTVQLIGTFKYRNAGQVCISPTRFFVQEAVYDRFVDAMTDFASSITVGDGLAPDTAMGPLANDRRLAAMGRLIEDAIDRGARVTFGGTALSNEGYMYAPTVLADVSDDALIMNEEPFGPVAPVVPFSDFDDMIARANALPFGLASYAFTNSNARAMQVAEALETGLIGINSVAVSTPETPFGGIKESGHGHEGGIEGLDAYLDRKFISQGLAV